MDFRKPLYVILYTVLFSIPFCYSQNPEAEAKDELLRKANAFKFKNQDSALFYLKKGYELRLEEKDTLRAINFLTSLSLFYAHNINYEKSYDGYWEALLLADKTNDSISKADIFLGLGWLYSFYKRNDEALKYFDRSLKIRKQLAAKGSLNEGYLIENYFSKASFFRVNNDYKTAKTYLDSIYKIKQDPTIKADNFSLSEAGYLSAKEGQVEKGLEQLATATAYFKANKPSYLVVIYALFGNIYREIGDLSKSETYFKKSLEISDRYSSHLDYKLFVFEELHKIYKQKKEYKKAITFIEKAKALNDKIYSVQNNQHLFEIKDKYRIEQERLEDLAKQHRIQQLEHEDKEWMLKSIILGVTILFLILFGYLLIRNIRNKHKNEKLILQERQKQNLKRHREVLELKNKELTESALRLIEKDEFISSIKTRLANQKNNIDVNVIKRILKSIQGNPNSNWSEFEARFTAINQSFYHQLKEKFPHLKQTDLKICALVKLNFASKDMAKLLGISVESVHTSRHRLRKKLGLERNDNLEEFINRFE
ncbi:tetratricopeptide repeat protein [Algibacter sp. 2305UL17-15]|uniref:tetratricopeptide repeat protein n=1 Tax=Algibacter sp. 2305UL17-15 TaxID=3231268 RepID=UPI003458AE4C